MKTALLVFLAVLSFGRLTAGQYAKTMKTETDRTMSGNSDRWHYIANYERDVVAETLWLEARGEGLRGIEAVASVIVNRTEREIRKGHKALRPELMAAVCLKPRQFSCWNGMQCLKVASRLIAEKEFTTEDERRTWEYCVSTATRMIRGEFDAVGPYTHYYAMTLKSAPSWSRGLRETARIGNHIFGRL